MPSLTLVQVKKLNAGMYNGFSFNMHAWAYHGEKEPNKYISLDGLPVKESHRRLQVRIMWREAFEKKTSAYGQTFNVPTGKYCPTLHLSVWVEGSTPGVMVSNGMGQWITIGEPQERRMFSVLQKLTVNYDDDTVLGLFNKQEAANRPLHEAVI